MRTGLWMAVIILTAVCVGGVLCGQAVDRTAEQYISVGQQLELLCINGDWQQADAVLTGAWQAWREELPWLCAVVNHTDAELVTGALTELRAAVRVKDQSRAVSGSYTLMTAADALREHELLSLENVL